MTGFCLSLISPAVFANHPTLLSNCNAFKLETGDFIHRVNELVSQIESLAYTDRIVQDKIKAGEDITNQVYAAGLINKMQDCNEDIASPNIQVVGGDPINKTKGKSFTLILRAMNSPHCHAIDSGICRDGSNVRKRPEIPNKPAGQWGQCLNNIVTWGMTLGKNLPMPNVAYINVELNLPSLTTPSPVKPINSCQTRPFSNACALLDNGEADAKQTATCLTLLQEIKDTINKVHQLNTQQQLAGLGIQQREELLAGLLKSLVIPKQIPDSDLIQKDRMISAESIYNSGPNNNIDSQYWTSELSKYDQIGDRIYQKACSNGWQYLFETPSYWTTLFGGKRQDIIMQILAEFQTVIPIILRNNQIYFENKSLFSRIADKDTTEAYYVPPTLSEKDPLYPWRDTIILTGWSYQTKLANPVYFDVFIRILLEEMMHAHQRELWENDLEDGKLPKETNACYQAHLFKYNAVLYSGSNAYASQPLELHAKIFSEYVKFSLFDTGRKCP